MGHSSPGVYKVKSNVFMHGDKLFYPETLGRGEFLRGYLGTGDNETGPYVFAKDDLVKVKK